MDNQEEGNSSLKNNFKYIIYSYRRRLQSKSKRNI